MKRKKIILLMFVITMGIFVLSACSGGEAGQKEVSEQEQKKESSADLSQFADDNRDIWNDSWEQDTASGDSVVINLTAQIEVPKMEQMSAVEVQRYEFSEENKKELAEAIFGKDNYKSDDYTGERDGVQYELSFASDETSSSIYVGACDPVDVYPKEIEGKKGNYNRYKQDIKLESENQCGITKEEAEKMAREFLQKAGFSDVIQTDQNPMAWQSLKQEEESFINGWIITFSPGVGEAPFSDYAEFNDGEGGYSEQRNDILKKETTIKTVLDKRFRLDCSIEVSITDKGVIEVWINNPIVVISETAGVKLLPLENIKKIMREEMGEYATWLQKTERCSTIKFNRLTLGYYRVSDPENDDRYTYIPAWRLWSNTDNNPSFVVNAMDGTVIDDLDEKWEVTYSTKKK